MSELGIFLVSMFVSMLVSEFVFSEQQYDPHNDEYVTVSPDTEYEYENKYNPHTDEFEYQR